MSSAVAAPGRRFLHVVALAALLVAAGCGSSSGSGSGSGSKTLVILEDDVAAGLNPDGSTAAATASIEALDNLYDVLVYYPGSNQNGVVVPDYSKFSPRLAASFTQNGTTLTFKLRQGVKSCAGNTLSADDVIYTWSRYKSVSGAAPIGWFLGNVGGIFNTDSVKPNATDAEKALQDTEVKKIDDSTVQFTQRVPSGLFPRVLTIGYEVIFDSKAMKSHATADDPWSQKFTDSQGAAGYGPYCLANWTPAQSITLTANQGYYLNPQYSSVTVKKVPEDANRVAAIEGGQADIATALTPKEYQDVSKSSGATTLSWTSNESVVLALNYNSKPWGLPGNAMLRQAIAYALPYQDIINSVYFGTAKRYNSLVPPGYTGQKDFPIYSTDLDKAKQLLAAAGFPGGQGLSQYSDGLQLTYPSERKATLEPIAVSIQTGLAQIGVNISLNPITSSEFASRELTKKDLPFALDDMEHPIGTDADYTAQLYFVTGSKGGLNNNTNYSSSTVDAGWAKALGMPDGADRNAVLADLQQTLMNDLPWIPVVLRPSQIAVRKGITSWVGSPDTAVNYWGFTSGGS